MLFLKPNTYPVLIGSSPLCRFVCIVPFSTVKSCKRESFTPVAGPIHNIPKSKRRQTKKPFLIIHGNVNQIYPLIPSEWLDAFRMLVRR